MRRNTYRLLLTLFVALFVATVALVGAFLVHPAWKTTPLLERWSSDEQSQAVLRALGLSASQVQAAPWNAGLLVQARMLKAVLESKSSSSIELAPGWLVPAGMDVPAFGEKLSDTQTQWLSVRCEGENDTDASKGIPQAGWATWHSHVDAQRWLASVVELSGTLPVVADQELLWSASPRRATQYRTLARPWAVPRISEVQESRLDSALVTAIERQAVDCAAQRPSTVLASSLSKWGHMPEVGYLPLTAEFRGKLTTVLEGKSQLGRVKGATQWWLQRVPDGGTRLMWDMGQPSAARKAFEVLNADLTEMGAAQSVYWLRAGETTEARHARWEASDAPGATVTLELRMTLNSSRVSVTWSAALLDSQPLAVRSPR